MERIPDDLYRKLTEIREVNETTLEVVTDKHRCIRIIAERVLRGGPNSNYVACYEEAKRVNIGGETYNVWVDASYLPSAYGSTAEDCLKHALSLIG